jgi:CRISPR-associated protein Cas2
MLTVIAYDISDNKARTRLHKRLKELGLNTQKSVFECEIEESVVRGLLVMALDMMDDTSDSLRIYRICERCARKVVVQGQGIRLLPRTFEVV